MQKKLTLYLNSELVEGYIDKLGNGFDEDGCEEQYSVKSLRGFLQHQGEALSTEELCKPVEY